MNNIRATNTLYVPKHEHKPKFNINQTHLSALNMNLLGPACITVFDTSLFSHRQNPARLIRRYSTMSSILYVAYIVISANDCVRRMSYSGHCQPRHASQTPAFTDLAELKAEKVLGNTYSRCLFFWPTLLFYTKDDAQPF